MQHVPPNSHTTSILTRPWYGGRGYVAGVALLGVNLILGLLGLGLLIR